MLHSVAAHFDGIQTWVGVPSLEGVQHWGARVLEEQSSGLPLGAGSTQAPFPSIAQLYAGAVPTRDEIVAWYGQLSFVDWWRSFEAIVHALPYAARLAAGTLLAAAGIYLLVRSYRRVMRPTQADLVRRIANVAHGNAETPEQIEANSGLERLAVSARSTAPAATHRAPEKSASVRQQLGHPAPGAAAFALASAAPGAPVFPRPLSPQAFLTADQYSHGQGPWAVPLGHDLVRIGRHQENDIRLDDKTVHRYHALLHRSSDGDFLIRDLSGQSGNGVYVNGARIEQTALRPGDLVELGAVRLRFQQQLPS